MPDEFSTQQTRIHANTYNLAHVLFNRSESDHLIIPIRTLQYLAIIESDAFWFVDSMAYATRGDKGGRLIRISWHPLLHANEREGLTQHMDSRTVFYGGDMQEVQKRLCMEFYQAMKRLDQRQRETIKPADNVSILSLNPA